MTSYRTLSLALLTGLLLSACSIGAPTPPSAADRTAPTVQLTASPTVLSAAGAATFSAAASDNVGVARVEFYDGAALIATDTQAPFEASATYALADNGTHTIKAVAVDAAGNRAESSATLTVRIPAPPSADTEAPRISLKAAPVAVTRAGTVALTADASDNVGVTKVTFYRGTTVIGEDTAAPFEAVASVTAADNGTVTYRAVAVDAAGNVAEAQTGVTVNVDTTRPAVSLAASPGMLDRPGVVTVTASALDDTGVTRVEFYDNGTLVGTDAEAPYTATLSYTAGDNGGHTLVARAYDAQGNTAEASTTITVNADAVKPTVSVTTQPNPLTLPGTVTFSAAASDDRGVTRVEFYDNGTRIGTDTEAPYTVSKAYAYADNGAHTILVKAYDEQGNVGETGAALTVAITDANEPNDSVATAQLLTIGTPLGGTIAGQARDFDYFKFDAVAGDMLMLSVKSVSVNPASTLDPYVMILMPDGKTVLEKDDDSGVGLESEIRFNVPQSGTYYVALTSFDIHDDPQAADNRASNTYQIALTRR